MYQCSKKERQTYHSPSSRDVPGVLSETDTAMNLQPICRKCWIFYKRGRCLSHSKKQMKFVQPVQNNSEGICEAAEKVKRYDNAVLVECGLKEGQKLAFPEFTEAVQKKIIETGKRTKICGDCQWNRICQEQPSRWSK